MPEMVPGELASEATAGFDKVKFDIITIGIVQYNPITQYVSWILSEPCNIICSSNPSNSAPTCLSLLYTKPPFNVATAA